MTTLQLMVRHDVEGKRLSLRSLADLTPLEARRHSRALIGSQGLASLCVALRSSGYRPTSFKLMTHRYVVEPTDEEGADYLDLLGKLRSSPLDEIIEDLRTIFPGLFFYSITLRTLISSGRAPGSITLAQEGLIEISVSNLVDDLRRDLEEIPAELVS